MTEFAKLVFAECDDVFCTLIDPSDYRFSKVHDLNLFLRKLCTNRGDVFSPVKFAKLTEILKKMYHPLFQDELLRKLNSLKKKSVKKHGFIYKIDKKSKDN